MAVSRDDVISAYRFLLGRDPESEDAVRQLQTVDDWQTLRALFSASDEFREKNPFGAGHGDLAPIGRHLDARAVDVEVDADPVRLRAMFDRIAACWRRFGETEPHFSVLTNPLFKPDRIAENMVHFTAAGHYDLDRLLNFARRAGLMPHRFGRAMDFGCGVGRLTLPLAGVAAEAVGVDISHGHIAEARKAATAAGVDNATFVEIGFIDEIDGLGQFDLIISRIVLQHNPPPVMGAIYRKLLQRLAPGGIAIIQMPTFIKDRHFAIDAYLASPIEEMEMNPLPQKAVFAIIDEEGCRPLEIREDDHLGTCDGISHVFAVIRPPERANGHAYRE